MLESPRSKIHTIFNPKMSGHRRSSSLKVNITNMTHSSNLNSTNNHNNNTTSSQMQTPILQYYQSNPNSQVITNTRKKTSQNDVMHLSKNTMNALFNKKETKEEIYQKKNSHRRAASLSVNALDPLDMHIANQKKIHIGKVINNKKGNVHVEDHFNIDEMIDNKHKKLLSDGIISPPIDLSSPLSSPNTSSFLSFNHRNPSRLSLNNSLEMHLNTNSFNNQFNNKPRKNVVRITINNNNNNNKDHSIPNDILSTINDVEEELDFSFDSEDSYQNRNKGRYAPNPFRMISGGNFDDDDSFEQESRYDLNGCISAPPTSTFINPIPEEINEDYFQRRRSASLSKSQDLILLNETSAFKSFMENDL
eukprot:TRINITY_DN3899_c0_g2_i2.p1 TRINITY_DN3899_c0_g2~~TRINITY_DN3899_c0_g2_i2.p1  ORF type:complete len:363 (-),score=115.33 TRINITY_DN3899_c0_g2_i2:79-1167(-)